MTVSETEKMNSVLIRHESKLMNDQYHIKKLLFKRFFSQTQNGEYHIGNDIISEVRLTRSNEVDSMKDKSASWVERF